MNIEALCKPTDVIIDISDHLVEVTKIDGFCSIVRNKSIRKNDLCKWLSKNLPTGSWILHNDGKKTVVVFSNEEDAVMYKLGFDWAALK